MYQKDYYIDGYSPKQNDIWLDLGAGIGEFCQEYLTLIRQFNIHVICVEPNKDIFEKLVQWCDIHLPENTTCMNVGVWKEVADLDFQYRTNFNSGAFMIHMQSENILMQTSVPTHTEVIRAIPLDDILSKYKEIALIKADIEGAELEVFRAATLLHKVRHFSIGAYHSYPCAAYISYLNDMFTFASKGASHERIVLFLDMFVDKANNWFPTSRYLIPFFEALGYQVRDVPYRNDSILYITYPV